MAKATPTKKPTNAAQSKASRGAAVEKAPVKKAAVKKSSTAMSAAPAKKAASTKKSAPAKKSAAAKRPAPAKKAPAKKAPVKKALVKKVPVKKAPVKKVPVKKAPVKKPAAPAKKAIRKATTVICPLSGFEVKPEKPNLSPRVLERLEAQLREERERHVAQADTMAAEAELLAAEREGGDTQFDEESGEGDTINIERERDLLLSASANQIVDDIDRALERIAAGTYGVCVPAGRRISIDRLEALPYAETCVDCKARAERRR